MPGRIGDGFGAPREGGRTHTGIDFPVPSGTRIGAAGVGVVEFAGWNSGGYGNLVVVRHRLGYATWYAHMSRIAVSVGQSVTGGTTLGYVGSTGHATGPHLHFELRKNAVPIDPAPYLLQAVATSAAHGNGGAGVQSDGSEGGGVAARSLPHPRAAGSLQEGTARRLQGEEPHTRPLTPGPSQVVGIRSKTPDSQPPCGATPQCCRSPGTGRAGERYEAESEDVSDPRAIACRSRALSRVSSSTPFSIATSRIVREERTASCTISVPRS